MGSIARTRKWKLPRTGMKRWGHGSHCHNGDWQRVRGVLDALRAQARRLNSEVSQH